MKNLFYLLATYLLFCVASQVKSQSIYTSWFSENSNICITLDSSNKCVTINEFYDKEECNRIKFKLKNNTLKLIWKTNQRIFPLGWEKDIYYFTINKLTKDTLDLTLKPYKSSYFIDDGFWEVGKKISFISKKQGCYDLLKIHKPSSNKNKFWKKD